MEFYDWNRQFIQNAGDIAVLVDAFGMAIQEKTVNLHLHGLPPSTFSNVWEMLFPLIHSSQIRAINFENSSIGDNGAIRMAQDFRQLEQLEYLCVDETGVDFEGLKALMMAAPPSVHTIVIAESRVDFVHWLHSTRCPKWSNWQKNSPLNVPQRSNTESQPHVFKQDIKALLSANGGGN
ncbi:unnamed protein product [Aphanomyces euteiches]